MKQGKKTTCPICTTEARLDCKKNNFKQTYSYFRCQNKACRHLFLFPTPTQDELNTYYNGAYSVELVQQRKVLKKTHYVFDALHKIGVQKGHLLEIGSSYGFTLQYAQKQGFTVTGIEIAKKAVAYCKKELKITNIIEKDISQITLKQKFDVIVLFDVIEHLTSMDDLDRFVSNHLKKGGYLVITTPNSASLEYKLFGSYWEWVSPPAHINLFTKSSLAKTFSELKPRVLQTFKGDSAGNTLFHLFLTLRYLVAYSIYYTFPKKFVDKLYAQTAKNIRTNSNAEGREFTGLMGLIHSVTRIFEGCFSTSQKNSGASLLAVFEKIKKVKK